MASPNYYQALSDMPAPTRGGEAQTIAASEADAKAITIQHAKDNEQVNFLAGTGLAAVKGYKEAQLQKEIDGVLNNTVAPGYVGKDVAVKNSVFNNAINNLPTMSGMDGGNEALTEFQGKVALLNDARSQGVMSRDQAVARIAAAVKSYSADLPGLATDFRKIAAEQTGISNIDVYGIHSALTSKATEDKMAHAREMAQLEQDKKIADEFGKPIASITKEDRASWYQKQQTEFANKRLEQEIKTTTMVAGEVDKVHEQIAVNKILNTVGSISIGMNTLFETLPGATVEDKMKTDKAATAMDSMLSNLQMNLETSLLGQAKRSADNPQSWNVESADKRIKSMRETFGQYREMIKSAEGRSMFAKMVDNQKGNVSLLTNTFLAANPGIAVYNELKILPAFTQLYAAYGGDNAKLSAALGPEIANTIITAFKDPARYGRLNSDSTRNPAALTDINKVDPDIAKALVTEARITAKNTAKTVDTWSPETGQNYANTLTKWAMGWNPLSAGDMKEWQQFYKSPEAKRAFAALSPDQQQSAVVEFARKMDNAAPKLSGVISGLLTTLNTEKPKTAPNTPQSTEGLAATGPFPSAGRGSSFKGIEVSVVQDRFTGQLSVLKKETNKQLSYDPNEAAKLESAVAQLNGFAQGFADLSKFLGTEAPAANMYKKALDIIKNPAERFYSREDGINPPVAPKRRAADQPDSVLASYATDDILKELKTLGSMETRRPAVSNDIRAVKLVRELSRRNVTLQAVGG